METMNFKFYMPARVLFGAGSFGELQSAPLPGKKALIVTGGNSIKKYGYLDRLITMLNGRGIASVVFDKIQPNPVKKHVMEGAAQAKAEGCDFVIGIGGGSSMDSAKSIAVMAKNPGDYWDYISGGSGKGQPLTGGALPIVCITTTAGTGTESDPWTVVTKDDSAEKIGFGCDDTYPTLSIVDPELMTTVPPHLTAYQGFDALFHSTEGYISRFANVMSDLFALKAIELVGRSLATAVADGQNLPARTDVALANTLSGYVESISSCTSEHAIEHAMSAYHPNLPHGAGLVLISVAYYRHFARKMPERMADMANALGAEDFVQGLCALIKACGLDGLTMSEFGITREELPAIARNSYETMGGLYGSDRDPLTYAECLAILEESYL